MICVFVCTHAGVVRAYDEAWQMDKAVTSTSIELCTLNVTRGLQNCTVHRQTSQKITTIIHTYNYIYHCKNKLVVLTTVVTLVADKLKCI